MMAKIEPTEINRYDLKIKIMEADHFRVRTMTSIFARPEGDSIENRLDETRVGDELSFAFLLEEPKKLVDLADVDQ